MDDMNNMIESIADKYFLELTKELCLRFFPNESIIHDMVDSLHDHGMPAKNIFPFLNEMSQKIKAQDTSVSNADIFSAQQQQDLADLLSRSGFMTISFNPDQKEGEPPNGNGRDGT